MLHYKTQWKSLTSKLVRQQLPFILKSKLQNQTDDISGMWKYTYKIK